MLAGLYAVAVMASPLHAAARRGDVDAVKACLSRRMDDAASLATALHLSLRVANLPITQLLLENGADPLARDAKGWSALHAAAGLLGTAEEAAAAVDVVLAAVPRASLSVVTSPQQAAAAGAASGTGATSSRIVMSCSASSTSFLSAKDVRGRTPLMLAAERGRVEAIKLLAARGARLDARNWAGMTPLHVAALKGDAEVVSALLALGACVSARVLCPGFFRAGHTPLHCSVSAMHVTCICLLVDEGADVDTKDEAGRTPLQLLVRRLSGQPFTPRVSLAAALPALTALLQSAAWQRRKHALAALRAMRASPPSWCLTGAPAAVVASSGDADTGEEQ